MTMTASSLLWVILVKSDLQGGMEHLDKQINAMKTIIIYS